MPPPVHMGLTVDTLSLEAKKATEGMNSLHEAHYGCSEGWNKLQPKIARTRVGRISWEGESWFTAT